MSVRRIYDGAPMCHTSNCCPVADHDKAAGTVIVHDPAKPENGSFVMTVDDWNTLIQNGKAIDDGQ